MIALALAAALTPAVGVGLSEYDVSLGRTRVPAGALRLNVSNLGEDAHDLVIRTSGGRVVARLPELAAGHRRRDRVTLRRPGRYVLFCSLADHEQLGMRARLTVRERDDRAPHPAAPAR